MRGILVLLVLTGLGLWWGGTNLYVALRNLSPTEITCADYERDRPDAKWLRLTHCEADLDNVAIEMDKSSNNKPLKVYVPLRPEGTTSGKTKIVVERADDDVLYMVNKAGATDTDTTIRDRVVASLKEPAEGLVQFGLDLSESSQSELRALDSNLASDFVILSRGGKPRLWLGLGAFVAGLVGLGFLVRQVARRVRA